MLIAALSSFSFTKTRVQGALAGLVSVVPGFSAFHAKPPEY